MLNLIRSLGAKLLLEGEVLSPDFGFDGISVFNNMMTVIKANIAPILVLMGAMLGAGWVIKYFRKARKGTI